jgi:hypothetical protein
VGQTQTECEGDATMDLKGMGFDDVEWICLDQDGALRLPLVNAVIHFKIP